MGNIVEMIEAFVDSETRLELAERMDSYGDELTGWIKNPAAPSYLTNYKANERSTSISARPYGMSSMFGVNMPASATDPLEDIRLEVKYVGEFRDFLEKYQNFVWRFKERVEINASADPFVDQLIKISAPTNWAVYEREGRKNYWCENECRRLSETVKTFSLVNQKTGSYADFSTDNLTGETINLLHFEVADVKRRGAAFNTLKEFKEVMRLILLNHPAKPFAVSALVLKYDSNNAFELEGWRFKKYSDQYVKNQTRLGEFWRGAGGVFALELGLDRDPHRIYFWNEEKALKLHRIAKEQGEPNPYRSIRKSIYGADIDKILKA